MICNMDKRHADDVLASVDGTMAAKTFGSCKAGALLLIWHSLILRRAWATVLHRNEQSDRK
jgi:hypothetical protein